MNPFRLFSRPKKIRKQVYLLTAEDLDQSAVWEFCLDEEGEAGQDEATVKPKPDCSKIYDLDGSHIAKAEFTFTDGKKATGYVYASCEEEIPAVQPVIITDQGQVMFWFGIIAPDEATRSKSLAKLAALSENPFPIQYTCLVTLDDIPLYGEIEGFYHYDRERKIQIVR